MVLNWLGPERVPMILKHPEGDAVWEMLGLGPVPKRGGRAFVEGELGRLRLSLKSAACPVERRLMKNIDALSDLLGFAPPQRKLLVFFCMITVFDVFERIGRMEGPRSPRSCVSAIAGFLGMPMRVVAQELSYRSRLFESGLIHRQSRSFSPLGFELMDGELGLHLVEETFDPQRVMATMGKRGPAPVLKLADYPHIADQLSLLVPYLESSLKSGSPGVNVCIHGVPGTGKTELARVLGKRLKAGTFEPAYVDSDGDSLSPAQRFQKLRSAMAFLQHDRCLLVCDEMEDLFARYGDRPPATKLWVNRLLESNPVPVIWLSNSLGNVDPAVLRRFDFVFELPVPPREQRLRILRKAVGNRVARQVVESLAECEHLPPAVVSRASAVLARVDDGMSRAERGKAFHQLVSQTLKAQGRPAPVVRTGDDHLAYLPGATASSVDLESLASGLRELPEARLCLHGPPGTGKSAFGRWLAESLDRPLHAHRLSDLLSMFVGGTEQQLAKAFHKATDEGAILLLDEVDSLLSDRGRAVRSWEVSQVNEMLTQMESFRGILVATTNRIDSLDVASRRRFDLSIGFDYLGTGQIEEFFKHACHSLKLGKEPCPGSVARIPNATPGDFAALIRQHRFKPFAGADGFAQALMDWCREKPDGNTAREIGFHG